MQLGWTPKDLSVRIRGVAKIAALVFIAAYSLIYWAEPFSDLWNVIVTNLFLVIASSVTAAIATKIWARYDKTDAPRRVWRYYATGLWLWAAGEVTWGYLNVTQGEVPVGSPDVFWVVAYIFLGYALLCQYRLLARPSKEEFTSRILIALLMLLIFHLVIYGLLTSGMEAATQLDAIVNSFYPAADLLLVMVAIWLARNFSGGAFSRPWIGLLAFTFADFLYAWAEISGVYSWGINQTNLLSTVTDIAYLGAYLVLGIGILSQLVFLKYGLRSNIEAGR